MLLYATSEEASQILMAAKEYEIIGENYVWVVTESVIEKVVTSQFPVGMLGKMIDFSFSSTLTLSYFYEKPNK